MGRHGLLPLARSEVAEMSELSPEIDDPPPIVSPGYGVEHAQCVPPSEYSEPGFITESYQTLHPISSEELLTLKYESEYPAVILRDTPLNPLQADYFTVKQEVVSPDNMCVGRLSRGEDARLQAGRPSAFRRVWKKGFFAKPPPLAERMENKAKLKY